ncbi:translocase [Blastopirellula marina DSM 3645]|uniref:Translocase n=1 Tax=Blastopirellula marina DSM 3645 TaxID=314230 RepID=A3ZNC7_9BACT|nr:translocase [Blastopirellula marina DSM 3645]
MRKRPEEDTNFAGKMCANPFRWVAYKDYTTRSTALRSGPLGLFAENRSILIAKSCNCLKIGRIDGPAVENRLQDRNNHPVQLVER